MQVSLTEQLLIRCPRITCPLITGLLITCLLHILYGQLTLHSAKTAQPIDILLNAYVQGCGAHILSRRFMEVLSACLQFGIINAALLHIHCWLACSEALSNRAHGLLCVQTSSRARDLQQTASSRQRQCGKLQMLQNKFEALRYASHTSLHVYVRKAAAQHCLPALYTSLTILMQRSRFIPATHALSAFQVALLP